MTERPTREHIEAARAAGQQTTAPTSVALGSLGPLVTATDVDAWVLEAIGTWLPTYLALYERDRGIKTGTYPRPATGHILTAISDAEFTDRQLPAIVVTALTNAGEPTRNPDWSYAAVARVNISAVVRGRTPAETRQTAAVYEACCRQLLAQKGVPGVARQRWRGWQILPIPDTDSQGRYLAAGVTIFDFSIDQMAQGGFNGPSIPIDDGMTQIYVGGASIVDVTVDIQPIAPPQAPVNTRPPFVTGQPAVGQALKIDTGLWTNVDQDTTYTYQWLSGGTAITGATSSTYTPATTDSGKAIACQVTATNTVGSTSAQSAATTIA